MSDSSSVLPDTSRYLYACFGLCTQSFIEFRYVPKSVSDDPDVIITTGTIPKDYKKLPALSPDAYGNKEVIVYNHPLVGRIAVLHGREIRIDSKTYSEEIPRDILELVIHGFCMAAIMVQRGYICFHGGAVICNDLTSLFLGNSGVGKSTFTAWCARKGLPVFGDDLAVVSLPTSDAPGLTLPSYPRIKIWKETAELLDVEQEWLVPIHSDVEKYFFPLPEYDTAPLPVSKIYFFQTSEEFDIRPIPRQQALVTLMENQYASFAIGQTFGHSFIFQGFINLLRQVDAFVVHIPKDKQAYENMANAITEHMGTD